MEHIAFVEGVHSIEPVIEVMASRIVNVVSTFLEGHRVNGANVDSPIIKIEINHNMPIYVKKYLRGYVVAT